VIPQAADVRRKLRIIGRHQAGIAEGAEVLAGEEREAADCPERSRLLPLAGGANRLGGVFDHRNVVLRGEFEQRRHVGAQAVEVNRDDGARARGDRRADPVGIQHQRLVVDVNEDRRRADA
jgi:hypothetical protein